MKKFNDKSGFTLIEIIVVLIIIGILAAIALPNLFSNVTSSKASTALASASGLESSLDACAQKSNGVPGADSATGSCSMSSLFNAGAANSTNLAVANGFTIDITNASGNAASNDLTYQLQGYNGTTLAFTIERDYTGVFDCEPGLTPYNNVC